MTSLALLGCRDPRRPFWEIGLAPAAYPYTALVGWAVRPSPIESGVPLEAAVLLARSMTSVARITFAASEVNADEGEEWRGDDESVRLIARKGTTSFHQLLRRRPECLYLVSTLNSRAVVRLFDDSGCPWWLQRQFILFSSQADPPPDAARDQVLMLLGQHWSAASTALAQAGVVAVGRPGVDGDVLGIFSRSPEFIDSFFAALEQCAEAAQVDFQTVPEVEFISRL